MPDIQAMTKQLNDQLKRESESLDLWNSFEPITVTDQRRKTFNVRSEMITTNDPRRRPEPACESPASVTSETPLMPAKADIQPRTRARTLPKKLGPACAGTSVRVL